ncbi:hypothetical protein EUZ85_06525 [Hahella sp. KA22]|uniref:hypothetical protein n=1 Tax=Hahella sp. KA22 TaxID=1628392 RepID=UPI000FDD1230|nr:hypothetical protein [Hahella sp. KA22]AZZ90392.1 hypothetical protein ENC22_03975 [Hahella sp. KA22]QAY53762.1 hypothetical protein EUZ85_06525 [Hahella sp. KA22]
MSQAKVTKSHINRNAQQIHIMSIDMFLEIAKNMREDIDLSVLKTGAGLVSPTQDLTLVGKIAAEIGLAGRFVTRMVEDKAYIVIKGYSGLRKSLTGTRYLASNPKVVDMAIGQLGVNSNLIKGARLTIYLTVPLTVLQFILSDEKSLSVLIGTLATDIVKVGVAATVGSAAAYVVGAFTTVAVGPLLAAVFLGVATSFLLEELDQKYGVTSALIESLNSLHNKTIGEAARQVTIFESNFIERALMKATSRY